MESCKKTSHISYRLHLSTHHMLQLFTFQDLHTKYYQLLLNKTYRCPFMKIWQIYLAIIVHKHWYFDLHIRCRLHITNWGIIRVCVHQPDTYGYIVHTACTNNTNRVPHQNHVVWKFKMPCKIEKPASSIWISIILCGFTICS